MKRTSYEAPHYIVSSSLTPLHPSQIQYSSQHPLLKYPQSSLSMSVWCKFMISRQFARLLSAQVNMTQKSWTYIHI